MKKLVFSAFWIAVIVGLALVGTANLGLAQTSSVKGILSSDATWTKAGSPYVLTGVLGVAEGVTLTIEPGVTLNFGSYYIQVDGTFYARGTSSDKIVFEATEPLWSNKRIVFTDACTSWNEQAGTGCIIENAILNLISIHIGHKSPKINNNSFNYGSIGDMIYVSGGSPIISNNTMIFEGNGISTDGGSPAISDNYIQGSSSSTGIETRNSGAGEVIIVRNTIVGNRHGIDSPFGSQIIEGNFFQNNQVGINAGGTILNNTIENGDIAIRKPFTQSIIRYNNIIGNSQYSIYMTQYCPDVDATYNWWGTTDAEAIEQSIYDFEDDFNLAKVSFEPFLTAPNPAITSPLEGPTQIVTPTPTPYPTPEPYPSTSETKLTLDCNSSTSSNFQVYITGRLTDDGAGIGNASILLSYSFNSGEIWVDLLPVKTDENGGFDTVWVPEEPGNYIVRAVWAGDESHSAVSTTITFAATPFDEQNVFSVATNSTMTELFFDSANRKLRFRVEGGDNTTGYVKVYISKAFLSEISDLKVYLDDEELNYSTESQSDSWLVSFTYSHSAHQVTINMGSPTFDKSLIGQALVIGLPLIAVVLLLAIPKIRDRKSKTNTE